MQLAMRGALLGWLVAAGAYTWGPRWLADTVLAWPVALSVLWVTHITAFAIRTARPHQAATRPAGRLSRRTVLVTALRGAALGMVLSLPEISLGAATVESCLTCCAEYQRDCYGRQGATKRCDVLYQNCVANCRSHGETPADWYCWGR